MPSDEALQAADESRIRCQYNLAVKQYLEVLKDDPTNDRAMNNLAICYRLMGQLDKAEHWSDQAVQHASSPFDLGRYFRDQGELASHAGSFDQAEVLLIKSLDLLPYYNYPEEWAATLGFMARNWERQGAASKAIGYYGVADKSLRADSNRHYELYNALHFASLLAAQGKFAQSRVVAWRCLLLSLQFGGRPHQARAVALFIGGRRLDAKARQYYKNRQP